MSKDGQSLLLITVGVVLALGALFYFGFTQLAIGRAAPLASVQPASIPTLPALNALLPDQGLEQSLERIWPIELQTASAEPPLPVYIVSLTNDTPPDDLGDAIGHWNESAALNESTQLVLTWPTNTALPQPNSPLTIIGRGGLEKQFVLTTETTLDWPTAYRTLQATRDQDQLVVVSCKSDGTCLLLEGEHRDSQR